MHPWRYARAFKKARKPAVGFPLHTRVVLARAFSQADHCADIIQAVFAFDYDAREPGFVDGPSRIHGVRAHCVPNPLAWRLAVPEFKAPAQPIAAQWYFLKFWYSYRSQLFAPYAVKE